MTSAGVEQPIRCPRPENLDNPTPPWHNANQVTAAIQGHLATNVSFMRRVIDRPAYCRPAPYECVPHGPSGKRLWKKREET